MPDKERPTADDPLFPQSSPESDTIPAPSAANSDTTPTNVTPVKSGTPAYFSAARHKARLSSGVFLLSLLLTLLSGGVFLLSFFPLSPSYAALLSHLPPALAARPVIAVNALFALLVMLVNFSLYRRGFSRFFRGAPDTDSLIAFSTSAAFLYSVAALLLTDPELVVQGPATYFLPLAIAVTFAAGGTMLLAQSRFNRLSELAKLGALPEAEEKTFVSPRSSATVTGHIALLALIFAFATGLIWTMVDSSAVGVTVFFTVLIAACPLTLGLTEPLVLSCAMCQARRGGLIIRDRKAMETASEVSAVVLGKTGLITRGKPQITDIAGEGLTDGTLIGLAASAEAKSYHPLAETIADHAIKIRARLQRLAASNEIPGAGMETLINGSAVRVGKRRWLEEENIYISATLLTKSDQLEERGKTVLFISSGNSAKGLIAFEDEVRPNIPAMLKELDALGVRTILLTGDSLRTAKTFARELSIGEVHADLSAPAKAKEIQLLQAHGLTVALFDRTTEKSMSQQADLTVALANDAAEKFTAGFLLSQPEMSLLPRGLNLSRRAMTFIRQNYIWTFAGPLLTLPAATGILYAFGGPLFSPTLSAVASLPGLFILLINAFRLYRHQI